MAARMVTAVARTIPTVAGFGFGDMYPSWAPFLVPVLVPVLVPRILEGLIGEICELLHTSHKNATSRYKRLCLQATPAMILRPVRRLKRPPVIGLTQAHEWFRPAVVAGKKRDAPSFLGQGKSWRDGYLPRTRSASATACLQALSSLALSASRARAIAAAKAFPCSSENPPSSLSAVAIERGVG